MLEEYTWCNYCSLKIEDKNGQLLLYSEKRHCFSNLGGEYSKGTTITIFNYYIKPSKKYADKYVKYIADMLDLDGVIIEENSFTFEAFPERSKNMLILTLVRILFEYIGYNIPKNTLNNDFFELLFNGKCKYKNKLKRFCYFYSKLDFKNISKSYFGENHVMKPDNVKIKDLNDFKKCNFYKCGVNDFFYGFK